MTSQEIRERFLAYFAERDHTIVASSPLVPHNDPTLLFTNAGMVQFKDTFLGQEKRSYTRATSSQKCVRAGGKHNDLENVGHTARHHTFFEMLGNFSFGDYFKKDAIVYAWEFLTKELKLPEEKLWVTVYEEDDEAEAIWLNELKVSKERFSRCGKKDNFWSMGETGPCGPCSEIFYDHGPNIAGGPPGSPDEEGDRYVEIWNLVFMQYNRDETGQLTPLPKPSVDTGMGLERVAAVMQGVHSNYDIDTFQSLIQTCAKIANCQDLNTPSLKVIADHIRSASFLISDGISPSNEGRGYVLRRIIRRALRHGVLLGIDEPFFHLLVQPLAEQMGHSYPELQKQHNKIKATLLHEEQQFGKTLSQGLTLLDEAITSLKDKTLPGDILFKLYDTYGFPVDLTADIAKEKGIQLDMAGFDKAMAEQKDRARNASQFKTLENITLPPECQTKTIFTGYDSTEDTGNITAILVNNETVNEVSANTEAMIILEQTPFYAESGGQVGDSGQLRESKNQFIVTDTQKIGDTFIHIGQVKSGTLKIGQSLTAVVDNTKRQRTILNHSATHLLHAALRDILGPHVIQKGSLVHPDYLRFDFSHDTPVSAQQLQTIEQTVNQKILNNVGAKTDIMSPTDAKQSGAIGIFDDKYGSEVRVLSLGDYSKELCGGTHVKRTGDIGLFKITAETGIAAGIRRIEAITGVTAFNWLNEQQHTLASIAATLKTDIDSTPEKLNQLIKDYKSLEKELAKIKQQKAKSSVDDLLNQAIDTQDIKLLATTVENADMKILRELADDLKNKLGNAIVVLATVQDDKAQLVASVTKAISKQYPAGELMKNLTAMLDGKGGGRPDMAQGGGNDTAQLPAALEHCQTWVTEQTQQQDTTM